MKKTLSTIVLFLIVVVCLLLLRACPKETPGGRSEGQKDQGQSFSAPTSAPIEDRSKIIEALLKKNRIQIGSCLQNVTSLGTSPLQLILKWNSTGNLASVDANPKLNSQAISCLSQLMEPWKIPTREDMAPLTVIQSISLEMR